MAYTISKTRTTTATRTRTSTNLPFAQPINKPAKPTSMATKSRPKVTKSQAATKRTSMTTMTTMPGFSSDKRITPFQRRVYDLLLQIPAGKVSTYAALSKALDSSPRAVGGALRNNPFALEVPCHRVVASTGYIGGFMGDWEKAPSGINQNKKLVLLTGEGVKFDGKGMLMDKKCWWDEFGV